MGRQLRNNIVIICEGTDTEYGYLSELKQVIARRNIGPYSEIRIIPTPCELKACEKRNNNVKKRKLPDDVMAGWYYTKGELYAADFQKYRQQPTRYVREAQLYLIDGSFAEAWAVYDNDNFPAHKDARDLADSNPNLHIAFSSISFEEWILLHFEHNPKSFRKSVCKEQKKDIKCGTGVHANDCNGSSCVGGRLRSQNYIPQYEKTDDNLFSLLEPNLEYARIGAAWLRSLNPNTDIWNQNPYTDFDILVNRLMGYEVTYEWMKTESPIKVSSTQVQVTDRVFLNMGPSTYIGDVILYDNKFLKLGSQRLQLSAGDQHTFPDGEYISFKNRGCNIIVPLI